MNWPSHAINAPTPSPTLCSISSAWAQATCAAACESRTVEIDQCVGVWYDLDEADRSYLCEDLERNQLGEGAFLGDQVWNQQGRFRIRVGPLGLDRFLDFLPRGRAMVKLVQFTRYLVGQAMAFDVQVYLRASDVPYCRLDDAGADAPRLGEMAWLKTREFQIDAGGAVFRWVN
jgi:type VI secretion system protein ImpH